MTNKNRILAGILTVLALLGVSPATAGETINVAAVLFGQSVELCLDGVSGPAAYVNTTVHNNDPSFPGKLADSRRDDQCIEGGDDVALYSAYKVVGDTIRVLSETQVCDESEELFDLNTGRQFYTGDYFFAPRFLTFPSSGEPKPAPWVRNYSTVRQHWGYVVPLREGEEERVVRFPEPGPGQEFGGGDYVYRSWFDVGTEGTTRVLYQVEQFEQEKANGEGPRINLSNGFKFHRFKKYNIDQQRLISVREYTETNPNGNLYRACRPSGGNCNDCTW